MAEVITVTFNCDLCGYDSKPFDGKTPKGWKVFEVDDKYEERKWHKRAICPSCVKLIDTTHAF